MRRRNLIIGSGLILAVFLTGCADTPHSSAGAPAVTLVPDNRVILDPAVVRLADGSLDISGAVHRQPTLSGPMSGRVDIEFVAPDGELLDELPALIVPHDVLAGKSSTYHTTYDYIPPKGSTLRIHFVDSEIESREDIEGGFFDYGSADTMQPAQGEGHHDHHLENGMNNHYASHGGGYLGNFGNTNFSPNGRR